MGLNFRFTPVNGYDLPGLERWLEAMAARGLRFALTMGPLTAFERSRPEPLRFHLEPAREKTAEEDPELTALYGSQGWEFLGIFRKNFFVFATRDLTARAHTDPETLSYSLKRFFRQKLLGGLGLALCNLLLLQFYRIGSWGWTQLKYLPAEALATRPLVPLALSVLGLLLVDLSYFQGLFLLMRHRRAVRDGRSPAPSRWGGRLLIAGTLVLLPVLVQTLGYVAGREFQPFDLEGSGFVTLTDIEGEDFPLTGDYMQNMDYVSHGTGLLLEPENWYYHQYGAYHHATVSLETVPHLKIQATRYALPVLAAKRAEEWTIWNTGARPYQELEAGDGLDRAMIHRSERFQQLILLRGRTVLHVEYLGSRDLADFIPDFARMLDNL